LTSDSVIPTRQPCSAAVQFHHRFRGDVDETSGPVQLTWFSGVVTTFDAKGDWTLGISSEPWVDPSLGVPASARSAFESEVGSWIADWDAVSAVVGLEASSAMPVLDEVGQLVGLEVDFGSRKLLLRVFDGEIRAELLQSDR
jgi:hypothetical protein